MKKTKLLLISALCTSALLFTGCGLIEPLTPEKFNAGVSDKTISKGFWKYYDKGMYGNRYDNNALYVNEKLCNFSPIKSTVGNYYEYAQENAVNSDIYETYKKVALERGNKVGIYKGSFNAEMMMLKLNKDRLPKIYDDKLYTFDATPLYAEFDKDNNLVSILISYTESYVMFNHVNNPSAPVETTLKTELYFGSKILQFKNRLSKKDFDDNLINMIEK